MSEQVVHHGRGTGTGAVEEAGRLHEQRPVAAGGQGLRELQAGEVLPARQPRKAVVPAVHVRRVEQRHAHVREEVAERGAIGPGFERADGVERVLARVLHRARLGGVAVELVVEEHGAQEIAHQEAVGDEGDGQLVEQGLRRRRIREVLPELVRDEARHRERAVGVAVGEEDVDHVLRGRQQVARAVLDPEVAARLEALPGKDRLRSPIEARRDEEAGVVVAHDEARQCARHLGHIGLRVVVGAIQIDDAEREELHQLARVVLVGLAGAVPAPVEELEHRRVLGDLVDERLQRAEPVEAERPVLVRHPEVVLDGTRAGGEVVVPEETHLLLEPARRGLHHPLDPPRLDLLEAVGVVDADRRAGARRADRHELLDGALLAHAHVAPDVARAAAETGAGEEVSRVLFVPDDHGDPPRRCCSTGAWARGIWKMLRRSAIEWHA